MKRDWASIPQFVHSPLMKIVVGKIHDVSGRHVILTDFWLIGQRLQHQPKQVIRSGRVRPLYSVKSLNGLACSNISSTLPLPSPPNFFISPKAFVIQSIPGNPVYSISKALSMVNNVNAVSGIPRFSPTRRCCFCDFSADEDSCIFNAFLILLSSYQLEGSELLSCTLLITESLIF
jgi:hypothetical protein